MRDYSNWPLVLDLQAFLESASAFDAGANLNLADLLDTAVEEFESETGYTPFLNNDGTETTRTFNAPGPIVQPYGVLVGGGKRLFLNGGLIAPPALEIYGVPQTIAVHFWPVNYGGADEPYTVIEFANRVFSKPNGIAITGVWGAYAVLPKQAFEAVIARAAMKAIPVLAARKRVTAEGSDAQIKAKATGPVRTEYATLTADKTTDFGALALSCSEEWRRAVKRFRLVD